MLAMDAFTTEGIEMQIRRNMFDGIEELAINVAKGKSSWEDLENFRRVTYENIKEKAEKVAEIIMDSKKSGIDKMRELYSGPILADYKKGIIF